MGLALHNYHAAVGTFPPGGIAEVDWNQKSLISRPISILPYLEQQALFDRYDTDAYNEDAVNEAVREALVPAYMCPSDSDARQLGSPASGPGRRAEFRPGRRLRPLPFGQHRHGVVLPHFLDRRERTRPGSLTLTQGWRPPP